MDKLKVLTVVGARPNFMKAAPIVSEMKKRSNLEPLLLHTGQHYDDEMSKVFFSDLKLPKPDAYLGVGGGSHAEQIAKTILGVECFLKRVQPHLVVLVGDVNSTLACAIVASKMHIPIAHVEAGLRSFDRTMPEEINRIATDALSDLLFITEKSAYKNLKREGIPDGKIFFVGNVMIDTLYAFVEEARKRPTLDGFGLTKKKYAVLTLHRPRNVDIKENLYQIINAIEEIQKRIKIVFPVHPRTLFRLKEFGLEERVKRLGNLLLTEPLGYLDFINLISNSKLILTDSGGVQEEATVLQIPCLTLRENTERPITTTEGTNTIVGTDPEKIITESIRALNGKVKNGRVPKLWDGEASKRIVEVLERWGAMNGYIKIRPLSMKVPVLKEPSYKRIFDLLLSTLGLIISLPVWIVFAISIWLEDRGPIFFKDTRVGKKGKLFTAFKFRSMRPDAEKEIGPLQAKEGDPRITKVGRVLRATALDELPQLLNIIKGDMSFVGPRALKPIEIELDSKYEYRRIEEVPNYSLRTSIRPGLTGIAQIYAPRDINRRNKFRYDAIYVKNMGFLLDIKLILLSFWITFVGRWEVRGDKLSPVLAKKRTKEINLEKEKPIVEKKLIGQILLEARVINEEQLKEALEYQKISGGKIGENLIKKRYISESVLKRFLEKQLVINGGQYQSL